MTVFDLFVLAIVGASVVAGALRGFVRALIATLGLVLGLFVAAHTYEPAGSLLRSLGLVQSNAAAHAGGFLLVAGLLLLAGFVVGEFAKSGLRRVRLGWLDRVLGAGFGFLRGVGVCSVVYLALTAFPVRLESVAQARTGPALAEGARLLALCTSTDVRARFLAEYRRLSA
ncbi:MAG TPA: CvpA family protein [Pyrinomonadaceae bacterium]|jgi:membrane protein required for colicin V production|nr:CvpA family protein [Pyrinomonadaceae bacterium]